MMNERLKAQYPTGTRVALIEMDDAYAPPIGTLGTVQYIDDMNTIHVNWDNGSTLGVVYQVDRIRKV